MSNLRTVILLTVVAGIFLICLAGCSHFDSMLKGYRTPTGKLAANTAENPVSPDDLNLSTDVFSILRDRPPVPPTDARGYVAPEIPDHLMPASGSMVIDRRATVQLNKRSGWYVARFENEEGEYYELPRVLLPCDMTEELSELNAENPNAILRLTGETFVYKGQPYLLPVIASIDTPEHAMPSPKEPDQAIPPKNGTKDESADPEASQETSSETVLQGLQKYRDANPVIAEDRRKTGGKSPVPSAAPALEAEVAPGRSTLVVDRLVVVTHESTSKWWVVRFEADNTLIEGPIRILPCKLLEKVESIVGSNPKNYLRFRVSGDVYSYKGKYYLMLRKLLVEREMGQF